MRDTQSLQDLFHNRIFKVPDYQRGYAWDEQQVGEFLDDLELLDSDRFHYTGTVVLFERPDARHLMDNEGNSYVETEIVDGQQRLTTIVLLLSELSRALRKCASSRVLADGVAKRYVVSADIDGQPLHKLSLSDDTDYFFKNSVLSNGSVEGRPVMAAQRLEDARQQIADHLHRADGDDQTREAWLRELHAKVTTRLHFNLYEVDWEGEVGVIFEVMNDRGKQLTDLEKVKNYLLHAASSLRVTTDSRDNLASLVNNTWGQVLRQLMDAGLGTPANENQLLRAHWLMTYDPRPRHWDGSKSIRRRFDLRNRDGHPQLLGELRSYVQGLRESCVSFCDALRPGRDNAFASFPSGSRATDGVIRWNGKLLRIGLAAVFLPLLMAVRVRWPAEPQKYLEVLRLCEVLAFRTYRMAGYYASYRQPAMFSLAFDVTHERINFNEVLKEIKQLYGNYQLRQTFEVFTNAESLHSLYEWGGLRYFLYEYEEHLASGRRGLPKVDWAEMTQGDTVEHVLPQSIDGQPYWESRFDQDTHRRYRHDIGNLTLTKYNPSLGNKAFPDKRGQEHAEMQCYANSLLLVESELTRWEDWTTGAIDERRATLLEWARQRWHVDFEDTSDDTYDEQLEEEGDGA